MTESVSTTVETSAPRAAADAPARAARRPQQRNPRGRKPAAAAPARPARPLHPVLAQLAQLHPMLFGETVQPLKRGIFQDLMALHGEALDKAGLKVALSIHTRSTRYLTAVANGAPRHDLQGQVVEPMAAEHVFHAMVEVSKRKKPREGEDLNAKLQRRMEQAFIASGLTREQYVQRVQVPDAQIQTLLDAALNRVAEQDAKAEAIQRAYVASGSGDVRAFADMYGMPANIVMRQLHRARQLQAAQEAAQAAATAA